MKLNEDIILDLLNLRIDSSIDKEDKEKISQAFKLAIEDSKITKILKEDNLSYTLDQLSTLLDYTIGEYQFHKKLKKEISIKEIALTSSNKYTILIEDDRNIIDQGINYFDPVVSTLKCAQVYLNKINTPLCHTNPSISLINDIFNTIFKKTSGFCNMLTLGLYPDTFVSWRTIHESECILSLLVNGKNQTRLAYVKHIAYNNAFRNQDIYTKEELDKIFDQLKGEMKDHNLKSKDMKKFIEYGWLYAYPEYDPNDVNFKLNFRDGIEKLCGLSRYSKIYEGASEIAHSSSTFFYVNDDFCKDFSLALVYQSAIRISELYFTYMTNYFKVHQEEFKIATKLVDDVKKLSTILDKKIENIEIK